MKTLARIVSACMLIAVLVSCAQPTPAAPPPAPTTAPQAPAPAATKAPAPTAKPTDVPAPTLSPAEAWLKAAELGKYAPAKQDWAAIEAAAKKEGKVVVYANSSRIEDEIKLFEAKYPGIKLEGYDTDDIVTKVVEEEKAGNVVGDVWFNSDGAQLFGEVYPKGYVVPFVPDSVLSVMPGVTKDQPFAIARNGVRALGYNTELNPKGCPITNWWQLTEPAWKGKIFIEDPLSDVSTMSILTHITQRGDDLAAAYKALYGKDIVLDKDTPNAGWMWLKKFAQNKPVPEPGGDETVEAFASPKMKEAGVGFTSYSKYRDTQKGKLVFDVCKDANPVMGIETATYLAILNRAQHPNAAKLFINFVLSEEGRQPWAVIGDYSARTDQPEPKGAIPPKDLKVWLMDDAFVYKNISQVRDFWTLNFLAK